MYDEFPTYTINNLVLSRFRQQYAGKKKKVA